MHIKITPDWPAPSSVHAFTTTRHSFDVQKKAEFRQNFHLPNEPVWLQQVHKATVVTAKQYNVPPLADASYTNKPEQVCAILTADCLPVLICDSQGTEVAAIHAGWRGLAAGIIAETLKKFSHPPTELMAWLGPAIGPSVYEVGSDVRDVFINQHPGSTSAFIASHKQTPKTLNCTWFANLYLLASQQLHAAKVTNIFGGQHCTYTEANLFYSYRREGATAGRMVSVIWLGK